MRVLLKLLTRVPLPVLYACAWLMYFVAFYVMRWRRHDAERDVANAFPEMVAAVDEFLREARSRFGSKLIPRKAFVYDLLSRAEQVRAYALIADQTPKHKNDPRHWTEFLNQETAFFIGAGKIAKFIDAKVLYVKMRRLRRGFYAVELSVIAEPPYEEVEDVQIVERFARNLERDIRESPADWLWLQKKWKIKRPVARDSTDAHRAAAQ